MIKLVPLIAMVFLSYGCGQNYSAQKTKRDNQDTTAIGEFSFDTTRIAILPIDTSNPYVFKDAAPVRLTNADMKTIEALLNASIKDHNSKQDTTKEFSEYIDIRKYKRQYVPFLNSKGEKKVYINCFCLSDYANEFAYWKKALVQVDDGGYCFFSLTINLSSRDYEKLVTNGYA